MGPTPPHDARSNRWHQALRLLARQGWQLLSAAEATTRRNSPREVILTARLIEVLQTWRFDYKGSAHALSPAAIDQVVRAVSALHLADGLLGTSERLYRLLTLGFTVTEFMPDGRKHQTTVPLVDWDRPLANRFDLAIEPPMLSAHGTHLRTPAAVAYVNGLPLAVIESGGDDPVHGLDEAIQRHVHHQHSDEIPHLYAHAHLLLALGGGQARYGTTGTPPRFWARWREEPGCNDVALPARGAAARLLVALLSPARLLEFLRHFVLFDRRRGKVVARYPQFFGVRAILARIQQRRPDGAREGGVLWHTTGSGKSLTMVFLTKALVQHPATRACRVLVVTDRTDLEAQIARNFIDSGAFGSVAALRREGEQARAGSGRDLARRIGQGTERIVFTLLHKFSTASRLPDCHNPSADLVVLVDEGHRSQGGELHRRMRRAMPRAAYIAFTGTPLLKHEKTTHQFGPILHAHTWLRAVQDGTVAPLLYEERLPAPPAGAGRDAQRLALIAQDIATHFHRHIKSPGLALKGQVATASKVDAIRCQRHLDETGLVSSAVVMSPPDRREGETAVDEAAQREVRQWWRAHAGRHPEAYEAQVLRDFGSEGGPDLLIVVDRLLTGFDEPRNSVLYIDKPLRAHGLIQAVARVNRPHEAKHHGLLVDYRGSLKALDTAVHAYRDLETGTQGGFDPVDIEGLYRPWRDRAPRQRARRAPTGPAATGRVVREPEPPYHLPAPGPAPAPRAATPFADVLVPAVSRTQALALEAAVQAALAEHSLHPQNADAAIRQALLPPLYTLLGLDAARALVERVVQTAHRHRDRGAP